MDIDPFPPSSPIEIDWPPKPADRRARRRLDWRVPVGGLGRALIATGLLLFGFVAYQLWGTGIQQARSQDRLQDRFTELLAGRATTTAAVASTTSTTTSVVGSEPTGSPTGSPTTVPAPTLTAATAPVAVAPVSPGDPIARLQIPKIGVDQVIVSGVDTESLKKGPGHFPDTPRPGEVGNAAVAGHRSTFGAPFERVDELDRGDEIEVTTAAGRFVYRVVDTRVVEPTEVSVIASTSDAQLTLTSCWPKFSAAKRIVVRAKLDATAGQAAVVPSSTTAAPATSTTLAPTPSPATSAAAAATAAASTTVAARPADVDAAGPASDAFRQGWWSDEAAWGDVMAWGALLAVIALAAWWVSRRTRRNWLGALAGIAPFVVALYFFYENAARLLPPNI